MIAQIEVAVELRQEDGSLWIWPENWDIVMAFCTISSQWRTESLGEGRVLFVGLDYTGAKVGLDQAGMSLGVEQWQGVQVMEAAAMRALNEQQARG